MADIFRKTALEKISSPEQLDRSIKMISPSFWIAMLGGLFILIVALVWSIVGRIPVNVPANGMYMGASGIRSVVAEAEGIVEDVYVSEGDAVNAGQEIAKLDSSLYDEELEKLQNRRDIVEGVTFYSFDDTANADTKPLLDIKSQASVTGTNLTADQIALRERYKALSKQRKAASSAKSDRDSAQKELARAQSEYMAAQNDYNAKSAAYNKATILYNNYLETFPENPTPEQKAELQRLADAVFVAQSELNASAAVLQPLEAKAKKAEASYSIAEQTYNAENSAKKQLEDTVSQLEARVKGDKAGKGSQYSALEKQFDSTKGSILDQIDQELAKQRKSVELMSLRSRVDGKVTGLNITKGSPVQAGMKICTVKSSKEEEEAYLYVPVTVGKKVRKGMKVIVYPTTVNRQEYGHMEGVVTAVSDTVVSAEDMYNQLGDQALVQAYQASGPVIRAAVKLEKDPSTASGFKWSSKKGASLEIEEGTVITADIVTEEKAPITMLIPLLKEKLTIDHSNSNGNANTNTNSNNNNSNTNQ